MVLHLSSQKTADQKVDAVLIPVCEDGDIHTDPAVLAIIRKTRRLKEFKGQTKDEVTLYELPEIRAQRVIVGGLGKIGELDRETLRKFAGKYVKRGIESGLSSLAIVVPESQKIEMETPLRVEALMEGAFLANHVFLKYKNEKKTKPLRRIGFLVEPDGADKMKGLASRVSTICGGTILARDWVNIPSNDKPPLQFAKSVASQAGKHHLAHRLLDEKELKQKKFGAMLAVAAGSSSKPCLLILDHKPAKAGETIALVGKGVTFDSGGLNIKTGPTMAQMKADMSGAAAVAATLITAARLKYKKRIVGLIPLVENMISGEATRPGDIIRSYAGKTVEIGNTDAEGRLILIDAIAYAIKTYHPDILIDMATLTGACLMALGEKIAGVFTSDDELANSILECGEKTHERCWRLPLPEDYKDLLKSDYADINNLPSTRWGGAITAALFLSEFTEGTRWAHIDIAGPAFLKKENSYGVPGGTGFGVRLLTELLGNI
jgi:leucyl aminopeptidase